MEMSLAERMIYFRAANKLTQNDLAEMVGVSRVTIHAVENGTTPGKVTRAKIELVIGDNVDIKRIDG